MILDRVTITGADNSVQPTELHRLQIEFPFVEWGILLSSTSEGRNRFPTREWINQLVAGQEHRKYPVKLSGHLCGRWVRHICKGNWTFLEERPDYCGYFHRFQLNFHAYRHKLKVEEFVRSLDFNWSTHTPQFIFQCDNVNNDLLTLAREAGVDAVPLFDLSGGHGVLPKEWPVALEGYCGYAGGLGPENVDEQLEKIAAVVGNNRIWIDTETRVRTDDEKLDLNKVVAFLEATKKWVSDPQTNGNT